jgi:hypothetical protein
VYCSGDQSRISLLATPISRGLGYPPHERDRQDGHPWRVTSRLTVEAPIGCKFDILEILSAPTAKPAISGERSRLGVPRSNSHAFVQNGGR